VFRAKDKELLLISRTPSGEWVGRSNKQNNYLWILLRKNRTKHKSLLRLILGKTEEVPSRRLGIMKDDLGNKGSDSREAGPNMGRPI
jgi:hypothetical protein